MKYAVIFILLVRTCAIVEPSEGTHVLNESVDIAYGATVVIKGEQLKITFQVVKTDSRCPIDVTCIWEGESTVEIRMVTGDAAEATVPLSSHPDFVTGVDTLGYRVDLTEVAPYPEAATGPIPTSDYVITVQVARSD